MHGATIKTEQHNICSKKLTASMCKFDGLQIAKPEIILTVSHNICQFNNRFVTNL